jgi:hypothetical protein
VGTLLNVGGGVFATNVNGAPGVVGGNLSPSNLNAGQQLTDWAANGFYFLEENASSSAQITSPFSFCRQMTGPVIGCDFTSTDTIFTMNRAEKKLEVAAPSGTAGFDWLWADSSAHRLEMNNNNGTTLQVTGTLGLGFKALGTSLIGSGACASTVTQAVTGASTGMTVAWSFVGAPDAAYTTGGLRVIAYATSGNVNFVVCNNTAGGITPGATSVDYNLLTN